MRLGLHLPESVDRTIIDLVDFRGGAPALEGVDCDRRHERMRKIAGLVVVLAMMGGFSPSQAADWNFTRWGSTAADLDAASSGRVRRCDIRVPACDVRLVGYHPDFFTTDLTLAGLQADAGFEFRPDRGLVRAMLKVGGDGRNAVYLQKALTKVYGAPSEIKKSWVPHVIWHDAAAGNTVRLIDLSPSYVLVEFTPAGI